MKLLANPMVNMSLVVGGGGDEVMVKIVIMMTSDQVVLFEPPLESTKEIMVNCLKEIVENTQKFPRWSIC